MSNLWVLFRKELNVGLRSVSLYLLVGVPLLVSLVMRGILSGEGPKPPKVAIVGVPGDFTALDGRRYRAHEYTISVRVVSMGTVHRAVTLTGGV